MSDWTHIVSTIEVDTNIEDKNIQSKVYEMLKEAPIITGSEKKADIFVNVLSGYNVSDPCDCNACRYKDTVVYYVGGLSCDADKDFQCPEGVYQTRVVITVVGNLRDRIKERTEKEYNDFIKFLENECKFSIKNKTVNISES